MNALNNLVGLLCFFPGPFLFTVIVIGLFRKTAPIRMLLFWSGVLNLVAFSLCICVPYYFQGYSQLEEPPYGGGLGWDALPGVSVFAYFYTFNWLGFAWLAVGVFQVIFGMCPGKALVANTLKGLTCLAYLFILFEFHKYEGTINLALE